MNRILCLLAVLSAALTYTFFYGALPSPDGWESVMRRTCLAFGILSIMGIYALRRTRFAPFMIVSALFFFIAHPSVQTYGTIGWLSMTAIVAFFVALLSEHGHLVRSWAFARHMLAGWLGMTAATGGPLYCYYAFEDVSLWYVFDTQLALFLTAFALVPAAWHERMFRQFKNADLA